MPILPHVFHDGTNEVASGQQVMDNFNALVALIEKSATARWKEEGPFVEGKAYTPSATENSEVMISVSTGAYPSEPTVFVGGVKLVQPLINTTNFFITQTFRVPAGQSWEVRNMAGSSQIMGQWACIRGIL